MNIIQIIMSIFKGTDTSDTGNNSNQMRKIPKIVEANHDGRRASRLLLTSSMIHDTPVDTIKTKEGFWLPDGRSYVSEFWTYEGISNVTYYFPAAGIGDSTEEIEAYLVSMGKLVEGERHPIGITTLKIKGEDVYSVTVGIGVDDGIDCETYCKARM